MDRNVIAGFCVILVKSLVKSLYVVVQTGPCNALDRHDADGVLIAHAQGILWVEGGFFKCQRHGSHLNLPKLCEFLPYYLVAC